jgi:hypothetical protein
MIPAFGLTRVPVSSARFRRREFTAHEINAQQMPQKTTSTIAPITTYMNIRPLRPIQAE